MPALFPPQNKTRPPSARTRSDRSSSRHNVRHEPGDLHSAARRESGHGSPSLRQQLHERAPRPLFDACPQRPQRAPAARLCRGVHADIQPSRGP
jgi:hypothetical protein